MAHSLRDLFLMRSDQELDPAAKELIKKWDDPPTPLQLLEVIDTCIFAGLCGGLELSAMQIILEQFMKDQNLTLDELVKQATWRAELEI